MILEAMMVIFLRLPVLGLLLVIECIISLRLLELRVPAHVPLGTRAQLSCRWQLGPADVLYSVKWYKDGKEFFRHVPRDIEPRRKFPLPGVDVEDSDSSGSNITLRPAALPTGGRYRCEVSGERPLFPTVSDHGDMAVIVLPEEGPTITGFKPRYRAGERVQVTCASGRSKPPTQLTWYINGEPAPSSVVLPPSYEPYEALEKTRLKMDFEVSEHHFKKSGLKVKCLATISPIYWRSNEESALRERTIHDRIAIKSSEELDSRADRVLSSHAPSVTSSLTNIITVLICSLLSL